MLQETTLRATVGVPDRIHFLWFGRSLPYFAVLAIRSALARCPGCEVVLWHETGLEQPTPVEPAGASSRFSTREIDIAQLCAANHAAGYLSASDVKRLLGVWQRLQQPAARSNLARLLILLCEGGVYLDTDTLTLRDLAPLRARSGFIGLEHILWSKRRLNKRRPYFWTLGPLLSGVRLLSARVPHGLMLHRLVLPGYAQAANNAALGFLPGHPFLQAALKQLIAIPEAEWLIRYRLGTHLVQECLSDPRAAADVDCLSPEHFYPLGPVVSEHYFRQCSDVSSVLATMLSERTYVIHWYASVSDLKRFDRLAIEANRDRMPFARLCADLVHAEDRINSPACSR